MSAAITVLGLASGKTVGEWSIVRSDDNLMEFLRSRGVPVASSCGGDGVCRRCLVNGDWMSCQLSIGDFLKLFPDGVVKLTYL